MLSSRIRYPRSATQGYTARQVAVAYGCPVDRYDGSGTTIGVIELGGGLSPNDLTRAGLPVSSVTTVSVDGATPHLDGPDGADGEVALDVQVIASVAPGAKQRVYFCPNTDAGFLHAVQQAVTECDVVSISWGGPESSWSRSAVKAMSAVFSTARAHGVTVFAASGDTGSRDSTASDVVDYPASDPNVVGCGGTRLVLDSSGHRDAETVWDDDDTQSATGGGVSHLFPGRTVPDVAGNADPVTGYAVTVDGQSTVAGGTSAVAPLYAAMTAVVRQATGGQHVDLLNTVATNPGVTFDVTSGDNGGYRAGPGRDDTTGYGVLDVGKLLAVLGSGRQVPTPGGAQPQPTGPTPAPSSTSDDSAFLRQLRQWVTALDGWLKSHGF